MGKVDPSFGPDLRRKRRASGRTLDRLAAELGVADKTVGKWERGEVMPSPTNILALEKLGLIDGWQIRNGVGKAEAEHALPQELSDRVRKSFGCPISELLVRIVDIRDESECMVIAYFRQLSDRQRWSVLDIVSSMTSPARSDK